MKKIVKRNIYIAVFIIILTDMVIGYLLFKNRAFSHLAIWKIIESDRQEDFYWQPKDTPHYFHFESDSERLSIFRNEIFPIIKNKNDEFAIALEIAKYLITMRSTDCINSMLVKWDSPEKMLKQIKNGASANCLSYSVLFSTYLASLGMKSRLWALENERLNGTPHTVNEIYIKNVNKWVFIDIAQNFFVTDKERDLLSFLEFREKLLNGHADDILVYNIYNNAERPIQLPNFYSPLIKCVFLRADNDFINKYNAQTRYGFLSIFHKYIDKFPDSIRRGLDYLLGRRDIFIHYVDGYSKSLIPELIISKLLFYFFIFSLISIGPLAAIFSSVSLKQCLATIFSKKDTRHK